MNKSEQEDNQQLNTMRHSAAHLLAAAVAELYPGTKFGIGPVIENGFYYDFDLPKSITESDLPRIEKRMVEIKKKNLPIEGSNIEINKVYDFFHESHQPFKAELVKQLKETGSTEVGEYEHEDSENTLKGKAGEAGLYTLGTFTDLCRGPHVKNTKEIGPFKLLSIAGAYWRGSEKNKMLTRIYGTAFETQKELDEYLLALEEAKKHDHRKLGQELELFTTSQEIGPGLILWLPKGAILKEELEKLGKEKESKEGYERVSTPHIAKDTLYYLSGHLPYYAEDMFPPMKAEDGTYYLKPMNCPHMHMIYKSKKRSYKELPVRYAEFGTVYRYEDSGTLMGLMRVRGLTQNDAHIYCSEEQAIDELVSVMKLHTYYYNLFGIKDYYIELALPDFEKKKDKYFDNPDAWEKSVHILREAAKRLGVDVVENKGGAAFYGPKFDFNIKSVTGREFGASTNQLDFGSGERFGLTYVDKSGLEKIVPYVIHRAPLGSDERFIGFLIEHYGGAFPVWLSPVQVQIIPITDRNNQYGQNILEQFFAANIRTELDDRGEKMQGKIRDAQLQKIPYMLIIGDREEREGKVAVRTREGKNLGSMTLNKFLDKIKKEIESKSYL